MHRNLFFVPSGKLSGPSLIISGEEAGHMVRVLRKKAGDLIRLSDGETDWHLARIENIIGEAVEVEILETRPIERLKGARIELVVGIPRRASMTLIIQKAAELGVETLVPVRTKHAFSGQIKEETTVRWHRIAREAAKQCGRLKLMRIEPVKDWPALFPGAFEGGKFILHETGEGIGPPELSARAEDGDVAICAGPEGGFSPEEVETAEAHGFVRVCLGPLILRSETAAIALTAVIRFVTGGFEP